MPKSKKPARKRGAGLLMPKKPALKSPVKPAPKHHLGGAKSQLSAGGRPKLFPGRTGGR
ncbi:hypothetical protein [Cognatishimia activa]|uniref:hypothetical protein n=1 Tax=Cognatishimia activa TaxID=1715691 RepID=UPI0022322828|nr:hypothetical protein [Cognatishimia activa]UZD89847.1 hypothetical protein M0D42_09610 [Cognatishimia activa]